MRGPRIAARALILREGRVLVSRYESDEEGTHYALPGGGQRRGESLTECLRREIREETGAEIRIGRLRWVREFMIDTPWIPESHGLAHQVELVFECVLPLPGNAGRGPCPDEGQVGIAWIKPADLAQMPFYPRAVAAILNGDAPDRVYLGWAD